MNFNKIQKNKGFTLIEILLYISIASMMLGVITLSFISVSKSRVKGKTISEIHTQGDFILGTITKLIENADSIGSPVPGQSDNVLKVNNSEGTFSMELNGDGIILNDDTGTFFLNNNLVKIEKLIFKNMTSEGEAGTLQFEFKVLSSSVSESNEYSYLLHFRSSASIRKSI